MNDSANEASLPADTAALDNGWPLVRSQRTWSTYSIFSTATATAVATWCFIIGGFVSYFLSARPGTLAIIAGSLIGILFIALACVPVTAKYGFDAVTSTVPQLGTRGKYFAVALIYLATTGWNIYLIVLLGRSVVSIADTLGLHLAQGWVGGTGVVAALLVVLILRNGAASVKDFTRLIAVVVIVLAAVIIVLIGTHTGWSTLFSLPPAGPNTDSKANWASGLEVLISVNLSWWAYTGAIVRNGKSARASLWPVVFALGLGVGLGSLAGFYGGLAVPDSAGDPTQFIVALGGTAFGIVAMGFIIVSSFGTTTVGMYSATLALRQLPIFGSWGWRSTTLVGALPILVSVGLFHRQVFDNFSVFLAFLAIAFAPMCGIQIVDYFLLRGQRYEVAAMYDTTRESCYHYWRGINPVAFTSVAVGVALYLYLLNPVTYLSRTPFQYLTASIPTVVVSGATYWILSRLAYSRSNTGGYLFNSTHNLVR
ncbi:MULTISPECIES: cytosine permease [Rhodococcus]|uniref:Uncharacterized protein n=1 Tax=Rhodococcus pyridinivorans AK37 TaxID=1114960 RepID=H0JUD8_9NOCA|nr:MULTISPECIES: cytosine permease [Rhodococcus]EHK82236.1 hypothetical protein AK37_16560 [Rhodococcus pyridinivorans AK37]